MLFRSLICARNAVQLSELTFDWKPAASRAQIVVNIASLPSTLTVLCGVLLVGGRDAGACATGDVCVCTCAGIGAGAWGSPAAGRAITAHNPINTICP